MPNIPVDSFQALSFLIDSHILGFFSPKCCLSATELSSFLLFIPMRPAGEADLNFTSWALSGSEDSMSKVVARPVMQRANVCARSVCVLPAVSNPAPHVLGREGSVGWDSCATLLSCQVLCSWDSLRLGKRAV